MNRMFLLVVASMILFPSPSLAQGNGEAASVESPPPVEVTLNPTERTTMQPGTHSTISVPAVAFDIQNLSAKCVVAVSLSVDWKNPEGKKVATGGLSTFRHKGNQFDCLESGQVLHSPHLSMRVPIDASGSPDTANVTVDFVIFEDGSTWGPGKRVEEKGRLIGKFQAYKEAQAGKGA